MDRVVTRLPGWFIGLLGAAAGGFIGAYGGHFVVIPIIDALPLASGDGLGLALLTVALTVIAGVLAGAWCALRLTGKRSGVLRGLTISAGALGVWFLLRLVPVNLGI